MTHTPEKIQNMFNKIAQKYDFINKVMSLGTQDYVKKSSINALKINKHDNVLDLCCGTGDLARIIKNFEPDIIVVGVDFSQNMLDIAKSKSSNIQYIQADATKLPFDDNSFDVITMGFGLRNIPNAEKAVEEIYRVLKPNGQFLHLDFGEKNIFSKIFDKIAITFSKLFTKNYFAYEYLIKSKSMFPTPKELIKDFESKKFKFKKRIDFLMGVISCQIMIK